MSAGPSEAPEPLEDETILLFLGLTLHVFIVLLELLGHIVEFTLDERLTILANGTVVKCLERIQFELRFRVFGVKLHSNLVGSITESRFFFEFLGFGTLEREVLIEITGHQALALAD